MKLTIAKILTVLLVILFVETAYSATINRIDNIITITGEINEGDGDKFKSLLNDNVNHVKLESPGGYVHEGLKIANLIEERKLDITTEATGVCTSMCAIIWMAGEYHVFNRDARIGFHLQYVDDREYVKWIQDEYGWNGVEWNFKDEVMSFLVDILGYIDNPRAIPMFIKGMYEEGLLGQNMWYPTNAQLIELEGHWSSIPKAPIKEISLDRFDMKHSSLAVTITNTAESNDHFYITLRNDDNSDTLNNRIFITVTYSDGNHYVIYEKYVGRINKYSATTSVLTPEDLKAFDEIIEKSGLDRDEIKEYRIYIANGIYYHDYKVVT